MHGVLKWQWQPTATATATAVCVDVASHFASGQRLFAYAAGQDEPEGMSRVGSRAGQGRGIGRGRGRRRALATGTVFAQRISGPLSSEQAACCFCCCYCFQGSYPHPLPTPPCAFVLVVCDFSHFAKLLRQARKGKGRAGKKSRKKRE